MEKAYYIGQVKDEVNDKIIGIVNAIAEYDNIENPKNRYSLEITLNNNGTKGKLTAIMFNPSEKAIKERSASKKIPLDLTIKGKKKTFIDGTITNVIKIANHCDYSKIVILNLFSIINSNPKEILKNPQKFINQENNSKIEEVLQHKNDVLIAWGNHSQEEIKNIKKQWRLQAKNHLKYFSLNEKSNTPTHPSPYNFGRIKAFLEGKNELISFTTL